MGAGPYLSAGDGRDAHVEAANNFHLSRAGKPLYDILPF